VSQPGTTTTVDHLARFVDAVEYVAMAVNDLDMHAPVPACPGWSTYDLVCHLGNIHAWAATIVETGRSAVEQNDEPGSRRPRTVSSWYAGKAEDLYQVLRDSDPARPCWNFAFGDDGTAGFWRRRQLHEATIHAVDLDAVRGRTAPIAPLLAEDGVDEVLRVFLHRMHHRGHPAALIRPMSILAEDTGRAWTVSPRPVEPDPDAPVPPQPRGSADESAPQLLDGPPRVADRRHPQADQVSAPAEVLYRVLWKRASVDQLNLTGDEDRLHAFLGSRLVP
jgi:uncharacterized protein (TIGR03083 family)